MVRNERCLLRVIWLFGLFVVSFLPAANAEPLRMMLQWSHQAQFAGYYVAQEKGFYREHGIEVTILPGGPGVDPAEYLMRGEVEFASLWLSSALVRSGRGEPLVLVAQLVNESNLVLATRRQGGINEPRDLAGRKISLWGGDFLPPYRAWLQSEHVQPEILPQYYSVNLFLQQGVDACAAMEYNEVHMLYQTGLEPDELRLFLLRDYGFGFPEDGIYTTQAMLQQRPEYVSAFRSATLAGWRYAAEHPDEALDIVMAYVEQANVPTNRPHMKWMLEKILDSIFPGEQRKWKFGTLLRQEFDKAVWTLQQQGMLVQIPNYNVFTGGEADYVP